MWRPFPACGLTPPWRTGLSAGTTGIRFILDEQTPPCTTETKEQNAHTLRREALDLLKMVVVFLVVFWAMKALVIEGYEVQGDSMLPTLQDRDRILVFKLPHTLSKIDVFHWILPFDSGDILVFEGEGSKRYVKRLIAYSPYCNDRSVEAGLVQAPQEDAGAIKVEYDRGTVRVNNWQIDESGYLPDKARHTRDRDICYLKPGEYYVLGDNREVSKDSRSFRAVTDGQVVGRAVLRFWPLSRMRLF